MSPPTKGTVEEILDQIAAMCVDALDPELTRETLARRVKDIWMLADQGDDGECAGEADSDP